MVAQPGHVRGRGRQRPHHASSGVAGRSSARARRPPGSSSRSRVWLWFTVLFANFAEAMAEGRGKAQAASLRKARRDVQAKRLAEPRSRRAHRAGRRPRAPQGRRRPRRGRRRHPGRRRGHRGRRLGRRERHHRRERAGHPRERRRPQRRHRRHARALRLAHRRASPPNPGETFLDRMIALVEGAKRQKTPNEIALDILLAALTIIFLLATVTLLPFSLYSVERGGPGHAGHRDRARGAAGLPDPDHDRRPALGHRHRRHGPHDPGQRDRHVGPRGRGGRRRGRAAARQDRHDHARQSAGHRSSSRRPASAERDLADAAQLASLADETPEGRSIVVLAKEKYGLRERDVARARRDVHPLHRADAHERRRPRTAARSARARPTRSRRFVKQLGGDASRRRAQRGRRHRQGAAARRSSSPTAREVLGVIYLKDIVKGGITRALRRAAAHGHQDRDDHRRQPADRRRHRRRGRRRRLPRRGHARGQAQADPRVPGRRAGWWP